MALIQNSTAQNVDVQKLKRTLETLSLDGQSIKVLNITPKAPQGVDVTVKFSSGADITSATHIDAINSAITSGAQRRKIIVNDKPGYDDEAGNKDYIDDEIDAHILALIGTAPSWLDTLGEIADALKGKVSTEIETATVVTSGSTKTLAVTKYVSTLVNIKDSAGNDTSLFGVTKNNNIITLPNTSTLSGTVTVTYTTVGEPAGDFGKYVIEWLESIDRKIDSVGLYSATVQFGTDPKAPINNLNIETFSNALEFITETSVVVTAGSTKQIPVSDTVSTIFSITDLEAGGIDISLTGVTKSGNIITLPSGSTTNGQVIVKYTTPELQYGKTFVFNVPDATQTVRGVITTGTQTIGGDKTLTGNTSIGGTLSVIGTSSISSTTITSASTSSKGLVVKGVASQSANLFEVQNSSTNTLLSVSSDGKLSIPDGSVADAGLRFVSSSNMGIYKKASNIMGFVANGQPCLTLDATSGVGRLSVGDTLATVSRFQIVDDGLTTTSGITLGYTSGTYVQLYRPANNTLGLNGGLSITNAASGVKGLLVKGASGQSANLFEAQNSTGTTLVQITSSGNIDAGSQSVIAQTVSTDFVEGRSGGPLQLKTGSTTKVYLTAGGNLGVNTNSTQAGLHVVPPGAATRGAIIQGFPGQTANLLEVQNSSGTALVTVTSSGNVGIGTTSPTYKLDIKDSVADRLTLRLYNDSTNASGGSQISLGNDSSATAASLRLSSSTNTSYNGANGLMIWQSLAAPVSIYTNSTERLRIDSSGNVGMGGITAPDENLHVSGTIKTDSQLKAVGSIITSGLALHTGTLNNTTGCNITLTNAGGDTSNSRDLTLTAADSSNSIVLRSAQTIQLKTYYSSAYQDRLTITNGGNVGIGTTEPNEKLHVSGNIKASGTLSVTEHTSLTTLTAASSDATNTAAINATVGTRHITLYPNLGSGSFNNLSQSGDQGIIFGTGTQNTGNLVIAPWANSSAGIRITSSGNVGVGISSPTEKLHVSGNIKTEDLTASGTITATTLTASANVNCLNVIATGNLNANGTLSVKGLQTDSLGQVKILGRNDGISFLHLDPTGAAAGANIYATGTMFAISNTVVNQLTIDSTTHDVTMTGGIFVGPGTDLQSSPTNSKIKTNLNENVLTLENSFPSSSTYQQTLLKLVAADTASSGSRASNGWHFIRSFANTTAEKFAVSGEGTVYGFASDLNGFDYAEFFEWADSNLLEENRVGYTVSLLGSKIKICEDGEDPIGVISATSSIVGDAAWSEWSKKYIKDDFGVTQTKSYAVYQWEEDGIYYEYEVNSVPVGVIIPENCRVVEKTDALLNPNYNPELVYTRRSERKEWAPVGLVGKLRVRKGQVVGSRWIKLRDISDTVEEWLVR